MRWNWQLADWPHFVCEVTSETQNFIYAYTKQASYLAGQLSQANTETQNDAIIDLMVSEAIRTSAIEGEKFDSEDVRSSIRNQLGLNSPIQSIKDPKTQGISQLMIQVRQTFLSSLTTETLLDWHKLILPSSQLTNIHVGSWRTDPQPMQIVSGALGHEKVHFEAPPSTQVEKEMNAFIDWFNSTGKAKNLQGPIRAAIAHIYFESIHPFDDGNGRIGRALCEKVLSQDLGTPVLLSLSHTIYNYKKQYYEELSKTNSTLNITEWVSYFVYTIYQAQQDAQNIIEFVLKKTRFFERYAIYFNSRQEKVIRRMFAAGVEGFVGGMSAKKYTSIADCSKATATRDLTDLLKRGCFYKLPGAGSNTHYDLNLSGL